MTPKLMIKLMPQLLLMMILQEMITPLEMMTTLLDMTTQLEIILMVMTMEPPVMIPRIIHLAMTP
jgi:hypothetical protein